MEEVFLERSCGSADMVMQELVAMRRQVYALALRFTGSPNDAEDIVQQAYLNACRSLRYGRPPCARPWFLKVVANAARDYLAVSMRRAEREVAVRTKDCIPEAAAEAVPVSDSVQSLELVERLRVALEGLDPESRVLISLCYEQGCSRREAAAIMELPLSTLSDRVNRVLDELRKVLEQAGFAAAPAVIIGALAHTTPAEPAGLAAKVNGLVFGNAPGASAGLGAVSARVKGGLAMKVILGIVAAGAVATGVATVNVLGRRSEPRDTGAAPASAAAAPAQDAPKWEHFAFASDIDYLDGPSLEALGSGKGGMPAIDGEGNLYLAVKYSTCRIRCLRADGRVETVAGDDRWPGNFKLNEGPAAYFPNRFSGPRAGDFSIPGTVITVYGLPLKGEEHGCIYFHWEGGPPYKIFKNTERGGEWWFRQLGTPGKTKPPTTVGQTVKLNDVDLTGAKIRYGMIAWQGNVYSFDEPKGEMTCLFTLADYEPKVIEFLGRTGRPVGAAEHYVRTDDGSVYLLYYWKTYDVQGQVFRMSPDRKQFEHIISDVSQKPEGKGAAGNRDGPGLTTTWHCGPANISFAGNVLFAHSIDSATIRRWIGGRMASLCYDGEWRETPGRDGGGGGEIRANCYEAGARGFNCIYVVWGGEGRGNDRRVYRFGPLDFAKPTAGPLREATKEEGGRR